MGWNKEFAEWTDGSTVYLSVVFSWHLARCCDRARQLEKQGYRVYIGGPAVTYAVACDPTLVDTSWLHDPVPALHHHNPDATFTTRGCIRHCPFCIVPIVEGNLRELPDSEWEPKPIVCDNNLLAASLSHFNHVIDRLIESDVRDIDFNQGLDARLLNSYHATRFRELHKRGQLRLVRLAWDDVRYERKFRDAYSILRDARIPKSKIQVYVLIGFNDTPEDALYRLEGVRELGILPNPMRYQPLDAKRRNEYVSEGWTDAELKRYMRYWARLIYTSSIPFEEFMGGRKY